MSGGRIYPAWFCGGMVISESRRIAFESLPYGRGSEGSPSVAVMACTVLACYARAMWLMMSEIAPKSSSTLPVTTIGASQVARLA